MGHFLYVTCLVVDGTTAAMLSVKALTDFPFHWGPHAAAAITMGVSSFVEIWLPSNIPPHFSCIQCHSQFAPQPHEPDVSEKIVIPSGCGDHALQRAVKCRSIALQIYTTIVRPILR